MRRLAFFATHGVSRDSVTDFAKDGEESDTKIKLVLFDWSFENSEGKSMSGLNMALNILGSKARTFFCLVPKITRTQAIPILMGHTPEHRKQSILNNIRFLPLPLRYSPLVNLINRIISEVCEGATSPTLELTPSKERLGRKHSSSDVSIGGLHVLVAEDNSMMANVSFFFFFLLARARGFQCLLFYKPNTRPTSSFKVKLLTALLGVEETTREHGRTM